VISTAELTGKKAQAVLGQAGISMNKNTVPDDPRSAFVTSGMRLGTASTTTQGMREPEMPVIASLISRALRAGENEAVLREISCRGRYIVQQVHPVPELLGS